MNDNPGLALNMWRMWSNYSKEQDFDELHPVAKENRDRVIEYALDGLYDPMPDDVVQLLMEVAVSS